MTTPEVVPLEDWYLFGGVIRALFPDGTRKKTSYIMSRDGLVVTTYSGSRYKLVVPVPTPSDLKDLDTAIKHNNENHPNNTKS